EAAERQPTGLEKTPSGLAVRCADGQVLCVSLGTQQFTPHADSEPVTSGVAGWASGAFRSCPRKLRSWESAAVSASTSSRRVYISPGIPSSSLTQNVSALA